MPVSARAAFEVVAGIIPGQVMPEYTKRWVITSDEWHNAPDEQKITILDTNRREAEDYARDLQYACVSGRACNWTRIDFVWF